MTSPAVSVILPTYNRLAFLREAVASVRTQTVSDWELLVIDDGSTDDSVAWLESLQDPRVKVIAHAHTGHPGLLRNLGLAAARGDWIAFVDSDDRWKPAKLERQLAYHAANPNLRWSYTWCDVIDERGDISFDARRKAWVPYSGTIVAPLIELDAMISLPSVIVARPFLDEVGGFNEARRWAEDQDLWLRLAVRAECGLINERLVDIRAHRSMTFESPEYELGFVDMYREFARETNDRTLRERATLQAAIHAVVAARRFGLRNSWGEVRRSLVTAMRLQPFRPFVYRAAATMCWRWLRASRPVRAPSRT